MKLPLPYLSVEPNRHGSEVVFVRRDRRRIRIREKPGTPEFLDAYKDAVTKLSPAPPPAPNPDTVVWPPGTLGWLADKYFASDEFQALNARS